MNHDTPDGARGIPASSIRPLTLLRAIWSESCALPLIARAVLTVLVLRADNATGITPRLSAHVLGALAALSRASVFRALNVLAAQVERLEQTAPDGDPAANRYALRPRGISKLIGAAARARARARAISDGARAAVDDPRRRPSPSPASPPLPCTLPSADPAPPARVELELQIDQSPPEVPAKLLAAVQAQLVGPLAPLAPVALEVGAAAADLHLDVGQVEAALGELKSKARVRAAARRPYSLAALATMAPGFLAVAARARAVPRAEGPGLVKAVNYADGRGVEPVPDEVRRPAAREGGAALLAAISRVGGCQGVAA